MTDVVLGGPPSSVTVIPRDGERWASPIRSGKGRETHGQQGESLEGGDIENEVNLVPTTVLPDKGEDAGRRLTAERLVRDEESGGTVRSRRFLTR